MWLTGDSCQNTWPLWRTSEMSMQGVKKRENRMRRCIWTLTEVWRTSDRADWLFNVNRCIFTDHIIYGTSFCLSLENELTWDDSDWGSWENPDSKEDGAQVCIKRLVHRKNDNYVIIYSWKCHSKLVCFCFSVEDERNFGKYTRPSFPYKDSKITNAP